MTLDETYKEVFKIDEQRQRRGDDKFTEIEQRASDIIGELNVLGILIEAERSASKRGL